MPGSRPVRPDCPVERRRVDDDDRMASPSRRTDPAKSGSAVIERRETARKIRTNLPCGPWNEKI